MTGSMQPRCAVHVERYIDDPITAATPDDYAVWFHLYGTALRCDRCEGADNDAGTDALDADFLRANRAAWGDRVGTGRELDDDVARAFASYLAHPSHAG